MYVEAPPRTPGTRRPPSRRRPASATGSRPAGGPAPSRTTCGPGWVSASTCGPPTPPTSTTTGRCPWTCTTVRPRDRRGHRRGRVPPPTLMSELSTHVHLVRFDELATDGTSVGWNYVQAPMVGQTCNYRWFVDVAAAHRLLPRPPEPEHAPAARAVGGHERRARRLAVDRPAHRRPARARRTARAGPARPRRAPTRTERPACYGVGSVADIRVPTRRRPGVAPASASSRSTTPTSSRS